MNTMNADLVRHTAKKYSGGREDLVPNDVDDPELLVRALVRKMHGELQASNKKLNVAEGHAGSLQKRVEMLQQCYDDAQQTLQNTSKELKVAQKQVGDYQSKIAFLGARWETLTGAPNEELMSDAHAAAKKYKSELRAAQSELFSEKLQTKSLQKEIGVWKATLKEAEDESQLLYKELVETRLKDQDVEQESIRVVHVSNKMEQALEVEKSEVADKSQKVKLLDKRVKDLQASEVTVVRQKEQFERQVMGLKKDLAASAEEYGAVEAKTKESAKTAKVLQERCLEQEAIVKTQKQNLDVLEEKFAEEKKWNATLQREVNSLRDELQVVKEEKSKIFEQSRSLERNGILEHKRAREAETEAVGLRSSVVDSSSRLVVVTHELSDERKKTKELEKEIVELKADLKEYQALAAERKKRLEKSEEDAEQLKALVKQGEGREHSVNRELGKTKVMLQGSVVREKESDAEVVRVATSLDTSQKEYKLLQKEVERLTSVIEDLRKQLEDSKGDTRAYRQKSEQLEAELELNKVRAHDSEDREFKIKGERDRWKTKFSKEEENASALGENVTYLGTSLQTAGDKLNESLKREDALSKELAMLKEKLKDSMDKGASLEASLKLVEGEREVYAGKAGQLSEEVIEKKRLLRTTQSTLAVTSTDLDGIKDSHDSLATQLAESKDKHAAAEREVQRLDKELKNTISKLKASEKQVAQLSGSVGELTEKLDDYALEANDQRMQAKELGNRLKIKHKSLDKLEVEANFSKDSVVRVCDDYKALEAKLFEENAKTRRLEGEILQWQAKLKDADFQVSELKDINWRIAQDLELSKIKLREDEALIKKTTTELKAGRSRMTDSEAKNAELSSNVHKLMEAVAQHEERLKQAESANQAGGTDRKRRTKKTLTRGIAPETLRELSPDGGKSRSTLKSTK